MIKKKTHRYAKTAATRNRLLHTAAELFAQNGYEGTTTRQITAAAGVNIAAIPYYFKNKEGLYLAVLASIAERVRAVLSDDIVAIQNALKTKSLTQEKCRILLHGMIETFTRFLLSDDISPSIARIFLREQMNPTPSFTPFYEMTMRPMHETLTRLVARATRAPYPGAEATLRAHALLGSVTVFKTHKELAQRRLNWKRYDKKNVDKILHVVHRHLDGILNVYRPEDRP
ncbi:MAG: CerR family C-terminal domain-containing protein [Alphaproteobacteria bacterium]|nr:CerR family C-terminal domain-containing protein [Alphaproteobacteria bacterium]